MHVHHILLQSASVTLQNKVLCLYTYHEVFCFKWCIF